MATWNTFPVEIHDIILRFFCEDIINQYNLFVPEIVYTEWLKSVSWPTPPQPLIDLSSALRSSRPFYESIHRFDINGKGPCIRQLQMLQKDKCTALLSPFVGTLSSFGLGLGMDVGEFMKVAGVFWKNPLIHEESDYIRKILGALNNRSVIMLLPHLEPWVLEHARPTPTTGPYELCVDAERSMHWHDPENFYATFETGSFVGPQMSCGWGSRDLLLSIKGLYEGSEGAEAWRDTAKMNEELIERCPVLNGFRKGAGEWWLFVLPKVSFFDDKTIFWVMVDYRGKRMWGNMCEQKMCFWNDPWNLKSWRLGEKKETFTKRWVICDWVSYDDDSDDDSGDGSGELSDDGS